MRLSTADKLRWRPSDWATMYTSRGRHRPWQGGRGVVKEGVDVGGQKRVSKGSDCTF